MYVSSISTDNAFVKSEWRFYLVLFLLVLAYNDHNGIPILELQQIWIACLCHVPHLLMVHFLSFVTERFAT